MLQIHARGKTALYDAVAAALDHIRKSPLQRKVLIVLSDGGDNASTRRLQEVLSLVRQSDVVVYTVGLFDEYDKDRNPGVLRQLARGRGERHSSRSRFPTSTGRAAGDFARYSKSVHHRLRPDECQAGWKISQCSSEAHWSPMRIGGSCVQDGLFCNATRLRT